MPPQDVWAKLSVVGCGGGTTPQEDVWGGVAELVNVAVCALSAPTAAGAGERNLSTYGFITLSFFSLPQEARLVRNFADIGFLHTHTHTRARTPTPTHEHTPTHPHP
jgi:hypothetical protein